MLVYSRCKRCTEPFQTLSSDFCARCLPTKCCMRGKVDSFGRRVCNAVGCSIERNGRTYCVGHWQQYALTRGCKVCKKQTEKLSFAKDRLAYCKACKPAAMASFDQEWYNAVNLPYELSEQILLHLNNSAIWY